MLASATFQDTQNKLDEDLAVVGRYLEEVKQWSMRQARYDSIQERLKGHKSERCRKDPCDTFRF